MAELSLYKLAEVAGMTNQQLADAVIAYVENEVGFHPAQALKHVFASKPVAALPPQKAKVVKTLTVKPAKVPRANVSVVFSAPKSDRDPPKN